jgi:uncharacterized membrane protein
MTTFLLASILLFVVWLALLLFVSETRREQVIMSVVGLVLAPGALLIASSDYRGALLEQRTTVGIEDLIFAFSLFGIASVIYQYLLGRHVHKLRGTKYEIRHAGHWIAHLILALSLWFLTALLLTNFLSLNPIHAILCSGLLIGAHIIADRHDLTMNALLSGLFTAALVFFTEQIFFLRFFHIGFDAFWDFKTISGFIIGGVPVEEIAWAAVVGFAIGPMYEWLKRNELR